MIAALIGRQNAAATPIVDAVPSSDNSNIVDDGESSAVIGPDASAIAILEANAVNDFDPNAVGGSDAADKSKAHETFEVQFKLEFQDRFDAYDELEPQNTFQAHDESYHLSCRCAESSKASKQFICFVGVVG